MQTAYTPITPLTLAYTNLHHILHIKRALNPQKLVLCVWDLYALDDHRLQGSADEKRQRLAENAEFLARLGCALGMDCKVIRLSEAWERVFKKADYAALLQRIMTRLTFADLKQSFAASPNVATDDLSLSMMQYHVVDYIVAAHLPEIFPELTTARPRHYIVSERFKPFEQAGRAVLAERGLLDAPDVRYTRGGPFIMDDDRFFPSLGMSQERITSLIAGHVAERHGFSTDAEREAFVDLLSLALDAFPLGAARVSRKRFEAALATLPRRQLVDALSAAMHAYFEKVNGLVRKERAKEHARHLFITDAADFQRQIRKLNWLKLRILKHCDGNHTCYEIARELGLNPNTVAVYFTRLRADGLITGERRPKRTVKSIVIDLENIDTELKK